MTELDPRLFRDVLGHYPTGVVLVTALDADGEPHPLVVGSFSSVSLDPPLVAYLPTTSSYTFWRLSESATFCINVLLAGQERRVRRFAGLRASQFGASSGSNRHASRRSSGRLGRRAV